MLVPFGTIAASVVLFGTDVKRDGMATRSVSTAGFDDRDDEAVRGRILEAAFAT